MNLEEFIEKCYESTNIDVLKDLDLRPLEVGDIEDYDDYILIWDEAGDYHTGIYKDWNLTYDEVENIVEFIDANNESVCCISFKN